MKKVFNEIELTVILLAEDDIVRTSNSGNIILPGEDDFDEG